MFPFGSVLTNIPLIVLAAAYLLYMGTAAFSRNRTTEEAEASSVSSGNIIVIEEKTIDAGKAYFFQSFPEIAIVSASKSEEKKEILYGTENRLPLLTHEKVVALFTGSSIFSRPPPAV